MTRKQKAPDIEISTLQNPYGESSSQAQPMGTQRPGRGYMLDDPWNEWREKIAASKNRPEFSGNEERAGVETMVQVMEEQRRRAEIANPVTNPSALHQAAVDSLTPQWISNTARDKPTPATKIPLATVKMSDTTELTPPEAGAVGQLSEVAAFPLLTSRPAQVQVDWIHYCDTCKQRFPSKREKKSHKKALHRKYPRTHCGVCNNTFSSRKNKKLHNEVLAPLAYRCADCSENFKTRCMFAVHQMDVHKIGYGRDSVLAVQAVTIQSAGPARVTGREASLCKLVQDLAPSLHQHGISGSMNATTGREGVLAETVPLEFSMQHETPDESLPGTHDSPWSSVLPLHKILGPSWKRKYDHICSDCGCPYRTADALEYHEKTYHPNDSVTSMAVDGGITEDGPNSSGNLECSTCGLSFPSKGSKKRHSKARSPEVHVYVCTSCTEGFPTRCQVTVHHNQAHGVGNGGPSSPATHARSLQDAGTSAVIVQTSSDVLPLLVDNSTHAATRDNSPGQSTQDAAAQSFVPPFEAPQHAPAEDSVPLSLSDPVQSPQEETPVNEYWHVCRDCHSFFSSSELLSTHQKQLRDVHYCPRCTETYDSACAFYAHKISAELDRHQINSHIVRHDHEQTITLPAAASASSINSASFHTPTRALQTPAAAINIFDDDSDSDVEVIFTPATTAPSSPSGILTPVSAHSAVPLESKWCPTCGAQFTTAMGAAHYVASPVHDLPRYRCPSDLFFTQLGLQVPSDGARHRKKFKTLAGLVGHVERGACRDRDDGRKVVMELLRRLTSGDLVRLLGGESA